MTDNITLPAFKSKIDIQHLVPEILSLIFYALAEEPVDLRISNVPKIFTGVCRHWCDVALNLPNLWSNIALDFGELDADDTSNVKHWDAEYARLIDHFTLPSRKKPLALALDTSQLKETQIPRTLKCLIGRTKAPNWVSLRLKGQRSMLSHFGMLLAEGIHVLERLHIGFGWWRGGIASGSSLLHISLHQFPKLRNIHIDELDPDVRNHLNLDSVRCLQFSHTFASRCDGFLQLLRKCNNVETLVLNLRESNNWFGRQQGPRRYADERSPLVAERLRSLHIRGTKNILHSFIDVLEAPELVELTLRIDGGGFFGPQITQFLRRSSPSLSHLALGNNCITPSDVVQVSALVPSTWSMTVPGDQSMKETLDALAYSPQSPEVLLFPEMTELIVVDPTENAQVEVLKAIKSRCRHHSYLSMNAEIVLKPPLQLKRLEIRTSGYSAFHWLLKDVDIVKFVEGGLNIQIMYAFPFFSFFKFLIRGLSRRNLTHSSSG